MILPRGLVILITLWIFAAWWICIGIRPPIQPTISSYLPGIRLFIAALAVGMCVAWPMLRLSERPTRAPIRQVLIDFVTIAVLFHMVIWPLRLATNWSPQRLGMIDLSLFSWGVIIAGILAKSLGNRSPFERSISMLVIVLIALLGPLAQLVCTRMNWSEPPMWLDGPIMGVLRETLGGGATANSLSWRTSLGITMAAVASWIVVWIMHLTGRRMLKYPSPNPN